MQPITSRTLPTITCDGTEVVSHARTVLRSELADRIGLTAFPSEATDGLRERRARHDSRRVLIDVALLAGIRLARATERDRTWTARGELTGTEGPENVEIRHHTRVGVGRIPLTCVRGGS